MVDHCRLGQRGEGAAVLRAQVVAAHGQATQVGFIKDGLVPGSLGTLVIVPLVGRIDHHRLGHGRRAVAAVEGQIGALRADAVAIQGIGPAYLSLHQLGVGVEQQLVMIEAVTMLGLIRTVRTKAVEAAGWKPRHVAVPDFAGAFG